MPHLELGQPPLAADPVHDLDRGRIARGDAEHEAAERHRLLGVARRRGTRPHPCSARAPQAYEAPLGAVACNDAISSVIRS
jgi:hypothetical protein